MTDGAPPNRARSRSFATARVCGGIPPGGVAPGGVRGAQRSVNRRRDAARNRQCDDPPRNDLRDDAVLDARTAAPFGGAYASDRANEDLVQAMGDHDVTMEM